MLVGGVVEQDLYGLGGEGLVLVYPQQEKKVTSVVGQGWAAKAATIDWYRRAQQDARRAKGSIPASCPARSTPRSPCSNAGARSASSGVPQRAIEYARDGLPAAAAHGGDDRAAAEVHRTLADQPEDLAQAGRNVLHGGRHHRAAGSRRRRSRRWFRPRKPRGARPRRPASRAARDRFYKGDIAREMVRLPQRARRAVRRSDFAEFFARVEEPASVTYRGLTVYKHAFNSQGPALLQTLNILENFDLQKLGHNCADYLHVITEAMKMAYADRDSYYADPDVRESAGAGPALEGLREGAGGADRHGARRSESRPPATRCRSIRTCRSGRSGSPGDSAGRPPERRPVDGPTRASRTRPISRSSTRTATSSTRRRAAAGSPAASSLGKTGVGLSTRGEQFWLDKTRAAQLRPRSRPRYTLTPSIVAAKRPAVPRARHPRRRQPGTDDSSGAPQHRRVSRQVVPEPAYRVRIAADADVPLPRLVLAAPRSS